MAVAHRHDGVGQYGFGQHHLGMAPPPSSNSFGYDRRPKMENPAEPVWPVPRIQHQPQQGNAIDRTRDSGGFANSFSQPELTRQQGHTANYTYDGSSSALRNPVVYSQPAQAPWGMAAHSSADYAEYPTASFMAPMGQRAQPPMHSPAPYVGSANGAYGDSAFASGSDPYSKVMGGGSAPSMGGAYEHTTETLWPLGPTSLDAFAGMPAPNARLTLTSTADKNRFKARSSLPPPKQFKCSACDAIFSRNHDLKRHARIHLAVKPFPCGFCDKAFSRKDALKRHVLVKGCGIGNKKPSDNRKRAATLSKLENTKSGSSNRAPYDDSPSRDFTNFRDDLHYQGQQQPQGFQGEASSSRSFPGRMDTSWPSTLADCSNPGLNADYAANRGGTNEERTQSSHGTQLPSQAGLITSYGSQQQTQPYPNFGMGGEDAFQQQQRPQLAGGLVNAFNSPEATSVSSPNDPHAKSALSGNAGLLTGEGLDSKVEPKAISRPGSANLPASAPYNAQQLPVAGSYSLAPMLSPLLGGPDQGLGNFHALKRQQQQQPFGPYFGNSAAS